MQTFTLHARDRIQERYNLSLSRSQKTELANIIHKYRPIEKCYKNILEKTRQDIFILMKTGRCAAYLVKLGVVWYRVVADSHTGNIVTFLHRSPIVRKAESSDEDLFRRLHRNEINLVQKLQRKGMIRDTWRKKLALKKRLREVLGDIHRSVIGA